MSNRQEQQIDQGPQDAGRTWYISRRGFLIGVAATGSKSNSREESNPHQAENPVRKGAVRIPWKASSTRYNTAGQCPDVPEGLALRHIGYQGEEAGWGSDGPRCRC